MSVNAKSLRIDISESLKKRESGWSTQDPVTVLLMSQARKILTERLMKR